MLIDPLDNRKKTSSITTTAARTLRESSSFGAIYIVLFDARDVVPGALFFS
jgi:hypothetical protein